MLDFVVSKHPIVKHRLLWFRFLNYKDFRLLIFLNDLVFISVLIRLLDSLLLFFFKLLF
jgi:hypothetical protein